MKPAYVSVVLQPGTIPESAELLAVDRALARTTGRHELVLVVPFAHEGVPPLDLEGLTGPLSVVSTHVRASWDGATLAGLARTVGDFVIEWHGPTDRLDEDLLERLLAPTDHGIELVDVVGASDSMASRTFYRFANALRPRDAPVRKVAGRVYSRHALGQMLAATAFEPQLLVLAAELPVPRDLVATDVRRRYRPPVVQRLAVGASLLAKGTRFGSAIPLGLATASALFGVAAALYSILVFLIRGSTPEGWTTLMIVTGLGQAAILAMLGLTWTRIDTLTRGLSRNQDATATVVVWPPTEETERS